MIRGKSYPQIAEMLAISRRTVEKHAENLIAKLEVTGANQAITKALEWLRL